MRPFLFLIMKSSVILNYCVVCISVLGVLLSWVTYLDFKKHLNPLIPSSLADAYFKPAVLYTVVYAIVVVLQLVSIRYKRAQTAVAVFGAVVIVAGGLFYDVTVGWFL